MTHDANWSLHLIKKSGADPEQQLVAALLVTARDQCAVGDRDACAWLHHCALAYLSLITPPDVDETDVLMRILSDLPNHEPQLETWREAAEAFTQAILSVSFGNPMSSQEPCEAPSPYASEWGRRMATRPATRPREPTPAMQMAMAGMEV